MLDIKFIEASKNAIKKDLKKRGETEKIDWVDELLDKNEKWKAVKDKNDKLRHSRNLITREISEFRKAGKDFKAKIKEAKELPGKIADSDEELEKLHDRITEIRQNIPNILHESVPAGQDDSDNTEIKTWGTPKKIKLEKSHGDYLQERGLADFDSATKISGTGFFFLKGDMVKLELALVNYVVNEISKKGYTLTTLCGIFNFFTRSSASLSNSSCIFHDSSGCENTNISSLLN